MRMIFKLSQFPLEDWYQAMRLVANESLYITNRFYGDDEFSLVGFKKIKSRYCFSDVSLQHVRKLYKQAFSDRNEFYQLPDLTDRQRYLVMLLCCKDHRYDFYLHSYNEEQDNYNSLCIAYNTNDLFYPAADGESFSFTELEMVYSFCRESPWSIIRYISIKNGQSPRRSIIKAMNEAGEDMRFLAGLNPPCF